MSDKLIWDQWVFSRVQMAPRGIPKHVHHEEKRDVVLLSCWELFFFCLVLYLSSLWSAETLQYFTKHAKSPPQMAKGDKLGHTHIHEKTVTHIHMLACCLHSTAREVKLPALWVTRECTRDKTTLTSNTATHLLCEASGQWVDFW